MFFGCFADKTLTGTDGLKPAKNLQQVVRQPAAAFFLQFLRERTPEQKELIQTMQAEQRVIREELTGTQSVMSIMEDEFVRLAKDLEANRQ